MKMSRALRRPEVRPVPRHPLPRRPALLRRRRPRLPHGPDAARLLLPGPASRSTSSRTASREPIPFSTDYFAFHPDFFPYPGRPRARRPRRRHGLLRPPPPPPDQPPRRLGRVRRLPGRELLPRRRPRHPLRPLRPRPRHRHRRPGAARSSRSSPPSGSTSRSPATASCASARSSTATSVAGAFDFAIEPGAETVMQIRSVLFPRREIAAIGIAPLTSMYFFGPERRAGVDDFRDAVHDSDGLRIVNGSRRAAVAAAAQPRGGSRPRPSPTTTRAPSASSSAPATSPTSRTPRRTTSGARAPGSSPASPGARARSRWSSSRPPTSSPTTSSPSGARPSRSPPAASTPSTTA